MPSDQRQSGDHHLGLRFWVQIEGVEVAGFSECSGFTIEKEVYEYAEGGLNTHTHKLPVRTKYSNITLRRGIDMGEDLYRWFHDVSIRMPFQRKNISIMIYKPEGGNPIYRWDLMGAYPVKWVAPELKTDAGASAIETLEFAHNGLIGFQREMSGSRFFQDQLGED